MHPPVMPSAAPALAPELAPDHAVESGPEPAAAPASPAQPALADLVAAGLVSHEAICDPALLGAEAEALRALCAEVGGPVWRLDAFHYAFRARPEDLGGRLAALAPADWTAAIEASLRAALGAEAVFVTPADLMPGEVAAALPDAALLLLRAQGAAVAEGVAAAGPGTQAVVQARFAVETARLAAGAEPGSALARRLSVIETRQEEIVDMLVARAEEAAELGSGLGRLMATLNAALAATVERLDAQAAALAELGAQVRAQVGAQVEAQVGAQETRGGMRDEMAEAFRADLGLALAEFLARLEQAAEERAAPLAALAAPRLG